MTAPGRLTVDTATGRVTGPAHITYNDPWPCVNGAWGSGAMMGALQHTMVGDLPGTVAWFNNAQAQASAQFGVAEDGEIHQFGPIGKGWIAWHAAEANPEWYGIEFADGGDPANPLTQAQIVSGAQLVECLSGFAAFPLQVSDSVSVKGFGTHGMGGAAWGGHTGCPGPVRAGQRPAIIALAQEIRHPGQTVAPEILLREGDRGPSVSRLQAQLAASGIRGVRGIEVTGTFEGQTLTAVRNFQHAEGLTVDGIVGPETWAKLDQVSPYKRVSAS